MHSKNLSEKAIGKIKDKMSSKSQILCSEPDTPNNELADETKLIINYYGDKIADLPNVVIEYRKLFNWVESMNRITGGGQYRRPVPCEQPFYLLLVHADGDISMCCADMMKELSVGHIKNVDSISNIVKSDKLRSMRKCMLEQNYNVLIPCGSCEVYSAVDKAILEKKDELLQLL